jgi:hypothetical protein
LPKAVRRDTVAVSQGKIAHPASTGNSSQVGRGIRKRYVEKIEASQTIRADQTRKPNETTPATIRAAISDA